MKKLSSTEVDLKEKKALFIKKACIVNDTLHVRKVSSKEIRTSAVDMGNT